MKINEAIKEAFTDLRDKGEKTSSKKWQAIDTPDDLT